MEAQALRLLGAVRAEVNALDWTAKDHGRAGLHYLVNCADSKELSYTDLRYRCLPPERVHHEAEQGPRPPGVRLHDDGPCDRGARRHDWGRPREDEDP